LGKGLGHFEETKLFGEDPTMLKGIKLSVVLILLSGCACAADPAAPLRVNSPDGSLALTFEIKTLPQPYLPGARPYYRVSHKGQPVLRPSPLGLDFKGAPALDHDLEIVGSDRQSHDSTWENRFGTQRQVRDHYNQLTVSLRERRAPNRRMDVIFRAYDEGVAFRYALPNQDALGAFTLAAENSGFYFAGEAHAYAMKLGAFTKEYEKEFERASLADYKPTSIVALPLVVELAGGPFVGLTEADVRDYAGMYVSGVNGVPNALAAKLSPPPSLDGFALGMYYQHANSVKELDKFTSGFYKYVLMDKERRADQMLSDDLVVGTTPKQTPWRVLLINSRPGGLIESNVMVLNLSTPCAIDTSWIQPGKAAWDFWSGTFARDVDFTPGMNTSTMKHYVDFAADNNLQYMLVDWTWSPFTDITRSSPDVDIQEILAHARQRGVRIMLWMTWTAVQNQMDVAFPLFEKWGVAGVKIDFMNRDDQEMVNFYERVARKAAEHHLLVDFHGAFKGTGLQRMYPNAMTREGVQGLEYSKSTYRTTPEHDVTIPFTRMLAGPMDYTPGGFRNGTRDSFKPSEIEPMTQGTRAHELAKFVVFESPLMVVADHPEAYKGQPGIEFIRKVPTVWDVTKVLNGEIGKYVTIARQKDGAWYLGAMTNWDGRDLELPLDFLAAGEYDAQVFADGPDADKVATSLAVSSKRVKAGDKLNIHLASGGGLAVIFTPAK
jgi:alpha-glucosidase